MTSSPTTARVVHARPTAFRRGVTFAVVQKGSRIEVSTALQHGNDDFTKKIGTKTAIEHFNDGRTVFLPVEKGFRLSDLRHAINTIN